MIEMVELTDAELDHVSGGQTEGGGVITAFFAQGGDPNAPVFNALPGLTKATNASGLNPPGHGQTTAAAAQAPR